MINIELVGGSDKMTEKIKEGNSDSVSAKLKYRIFAPKDVG